jgi:hypothetical protein
MTDIFSEIDDELQRERLARFWRRFGPLVVLAAIFVVLGVAGWRFYEWRSMQKASEFGLQFESALKIAGEEGKSAQAEKAFADIASSATAGYATLARFRAASEESAVDKAKAVQAFDALAADAKVDPELRDLAKLRAAMLVLDTGTPEEVSKRMEPLAKSASVWRNSARELLALAAWKAGNVEETQRWASELVGDAGVQADLRTRGQMLLDLAAGAAPAETSEPAPATSPVETPAEPAKPAP